MVLENSCSKPSPYEKHICSDNDWEPDQYCPLHKSTEIQKKSKMIALIGKNDAGHCKECIIPMLEILINYTGRQNFFGIYGETVSGVYRGR